MQRASSVYVQFFASSKLMSVKDVKVWTETSQMDANLPDINMMACAQYPDGIYVNTQETTV